jgi:hypothetical protein
VNILGAFSRSHAEQSRGELMATDKQIQANRVNAQRSTGPKTEAGKARSRVNSWKHGLTAKMLIIVGECEDDFNELRLIDELKPQSTLEAELVVRIAGILRRLRRTPFFEAAVVTSRQEHVVVSYGQDYIPKGASEDEKRSRSIGEALIFDGAYHDELGKLARRETALMNAFTKTMKELHLLQWSQANRSDNVLTFEAPAPSFN